jgi:hypothetical protein
MFARWVSATLIPRIEATSLVLLPSASRRTTSRSRVVRRSFSLFESSGRVPLGLFSSLVITSLAHGVKNGLCLASAGYALTHHRYRRRNDPVNAGRLRRSRIAKRSRCSSEGALSCHRQPGRSARKHMGGGLHRTRTERHSVAVEFCRHSVRVMRFSWRPI